MSTSLLYHGFGLRGYRYCKTDYIEGDVVFTIEKPRNSFRCPVCKGSDVQGRGSRLRVFRTLPIGRKSVFVHLPVARVYCKDCQIQRQVAVDFAQGKRHYTRSFARYADELCSAMTIEDVSRHLNVGWDTIKEIHKESLKRRYSRRQLKRLKQMAVDEIAVGSGHKYKTIVLNLETGAVVFIGDGKGAAALEPFWRKLKASRAKVEAVATDMASGYLLAVRENLPDAVHVLDRFHVVKLYNEKLSQLRRDLYRELTEKLDKQILKGTRWLLLMNPEHLDERRNERRRLDEALALNKTLATAYYMKEDLRQFWSQASRDAADIFLEHWLRKAEDSGIAMLQQFAKTISKHRRQLLDWYHYRISTGPLEATNNKIQLIKRKAYGYRDEEFFKLKIYHLHRMKHAFVG